MTAEKDPPEPAAAAASMQQHLTNLASGSFGLAKYLYRKTGDATKYVVGEMEKNSHTAPVIDAGKKLYNSTKDNETVQWAGSKVADVGSKVGHGTVVASKYMYNKVSESPVTEQVVGAGKQVYNTAKENQAVKWTGSAIGSVAGATYKAGCGTVAVGKQAYQTISESPVTDQALQWTGSTVGYLAGVTYKAASTTLSTGQQVYQIVSTSPLTGQVIRFTGAAVGSAVTLNMMATSVASRAGRELMRASCIRTSVGIFSKLPLPASMRATAVFAGVRTHDYIVSGVIPGLFVAWAVYDGYRIGRYAYGCYQDYQREQLQLQQNRQLRDLIQMWPNFYEEEAARNIRMYYFGMYAPQ